MNLKSRDHNLTDRIKLATFLLHSQAIGIHWGNFCSLHKNKPSVQIVGSRMFWKAESGIIEIPLQFVFNGHVLNNLYYKGCRQKSVCLDYVLIKNSVLGPSPAGSVCNFNEKYCRNAVVSTGCRVNIKCYLFINVTNLCSRN